MNTLMLVALAVVVLCYCGGKYCPSVLKQNKEVVLGVLIGLALCSFMGVRLEGLTNYSECTRYAFPDCPSKDTCDKGYQKGCIGNICQHDDDCDMCGQIDKSGNVIPNFCALYKSVGGRMAEGTCQPKKIK